MIISIFLLFLFIGLLLTIGLYKRKIEYVEYEVNINNIDPQKGLRWYENEIRKQINALLFTIKSQSGNIVIYQAPLLYLVNEDLIEVDYDMYYIKIKSSRTVKKVMENLLEINFI